VDIQITIKEIKWLKPADLDENLLNKYGVKDEKELRERMHESLKSRFQAQERNQMSEQIYKYMLDNTDFDLPLDFVGQQADQLLQRQYANLLRQGLNAQQIEEHMEQLKAGSDQQAKEQLKTFFIMDKVADKLKVEVTEEELNGHIAQLAVQRGQRPERLREQLLRDGSLAQFRLQLREDKCISQLLESAKIAEIEPQKKAKKTAKKTKTTQKAATSAKKGKTTTKKKADK